MTNTTPLPPPAPKQLISDRLYDGLKTGVQLAIPASATFYFTMASIWGLPAANEVVGSLAALATFLGVFLKVSNKSYEASDAEYGGVINVTTDGEGNKQAVLEVTGDPYDIEDQKSVTFKINSL